MKFIIEHLEQKLSEWRMIEYKRMSQLVGKNNLIFTNLKPQTKKALEELGEVTEKKAKEIAKGKVCILDQNAKKELSSDDKFDYVIFGGILGDEPPTGKTNLIERNPDWETRTLGNKQMSTDTAVNVTKLILEGTPLNKLKFIEEPEIPIKEGESVILPFRYLEKDGKPVMSEEIIEMLKKKKGF